MKFNKKHLSVALPLLASMAMVGCSDDSSSPTLPQVEPNDPESGIEEPSITYGPLTVEPVAIAPADNVIFLTAGDDIQFQAQEAALTALPGTTIVFPAGTHVFTDELIINTSHITLAGMGMDKTILDFTNQQTGAQGILSFGDEFTVQDFGIKNAAGDGIRIEGVTGAYIKRMKVEWTNLSDPDNGAYGLYPVQNSNVLIENSIVIGASDAGIYVGQSKQIIVRNNIASENVAGIEIENSQDAEVYHNIATNNTGGVLVFDLPGLTQEGDRVSVHHNHIYDNTLKNFAPAGNIVGIVPSGTGMLLMGGTDQVQIHDNIITGHHTMSVGISSYLVTGYPSPEGFDEFPGSAYVFNNTMDQPKEYVYDGTDLNYGIINLFENVNDNAEPAEIIYDGIAEIIFKGLQGLDSLPEGDLCIGPNYNSAGDETLFANLKLWSMNDNGVPNGKINYDRSGYDCSYELLSEVTLPEPQPVPDIIRYTPEQISALCNADTGNAVNWDALVVDCPNISDYNLFSDATSPLSAGNSNGIAYDLSTPLFSDYSKKHRVVFVPAGEKIDYDRVEGDASDRNMEYPVGTVIAKTFYFENLAMEQDVVETRLLIKRADRWQRLPYIWQGDDATLEIGGGSREVTYVDDNGAEQQTVYEVPNSNQCSSCHGVKGLDKPLGPQPHYLNYADPIASGKNQLMHWADSGILANLPMNDGDTAPADDVPAFAAWDDDTESLQDRALSYLDANCAHCHSKGNRADSTGLHLNRDRIAAGGTVDRRTGICKMPVAAGHIDDLNYDIVPDESAKSILHYRLNSVDPSDKMPELGKSVVHQAGVDLIQQWIDGGLVANPNDADDC
ncbi:hypothetical protein SIN8267_00872 [Sinobacterium norvegicum]|uniref:Right handed beta helix domain-containing protein n=1 Tax=Sinobacterium norvegicum TaxID=1641715 RepID=A0ABM9AC48_9GAMM|nr:parallel beta-helix domain-containing protein [Sinobacterium norvegicum]CAH0990773.1 hypothetical protein SIN8267_00872 [Sinobacterium norvegicum]